jgi:hypothetical protein
VRYLVFSQPVFPAAVAEKADAAFSAGRNLIVIRAVLGESPATRTFGRAGGGGEMSGLPTTRPERDGTGCQRRGLPQSGVFQSARSGSPIGARPPHLEA